MYIFIQQRCTRRNVSPRSKASGKARWLCYAMRS